MDEDQTTRLRWYRIVLDAAERHDGFGEAMRLMSAPDLKICLQAAIEVEAWRSAMPQYEFRDGVIKRSLASLAPNGSA